MSRIHPKQINGQEILSPHYPSTARELGKMISKEKLGNELKDILIHTSDIVVISRWAFKLYSNNIRDLDTTSRDILERLFSIEDDPQFEYTEEELRLLAELLINEDENSIEKLDELKSKNKNTDLNQKRSG